MNYQRFVVFVVAMLTVVALGVTVYYFMKDEEYINLQTNEINVNVGDKFTLTYQHDNALDSTKIEWNIKDKDVVVYNAETNEFEAKKAGTTEILLDTNRSGWQVQRCVVNIGDGSAEHPFIVSSAEQFYDGLKNLATGANKDSNYILISDIDLTNTSKKFIPLFNGEYFAGDFNGNSHKISNLTINTDDYLESAGLFYGISNKGKVHDLILENVNISGNIGNVGSVAGYNYGLVEKVKVNNVTLGSVHATSTPQIGGIVARSLAVALDGASVDAVNYNNIGRIDRCETTNAKLQGLKKSVIGGISATILGGSVVNSSFSGIITSAETGTIGAGITANLYANENANAKLKDNYAVVKFENVTERAGVVHTNNFDAYKASGKVISENIIWGQYFDTTVVADAEVKAIKNNGYSSATVFNKRVEEELIIAEGRESAFLKTKQIKSHTKYWDNPAQQTYYYDFALTWAQDSAVNNGYPTLQMKGKVEDDFIKINGEDETTPIVPIDPEDPTDPEDTRTFNEILSEAQEGDIVKIDNDLDWNKFSEDWIPVGTIDKPFNATFDGNGHTIKNITLSSDAYDYVGVFGVLGENAVIKNVNFENITITNGKYVGIVAGQNEGIIEKVTITNCKIEITTSNMLYGGGAVGQNEGTINNVSSNATITVATTSNNEFRVGGIVGSNTGFVYDAQCTSNINSDALVNRLGGIVGYNNSSVRYVAYKGSMTGNVVNNNNYAGGVIGYNLSNGTCEMSSAQQSTIKGYNAGGLIGYNTGKIDRNNVRDCTIVGERIGGLISTMERGTMTNTSAVAKLQGLSDSSIAGGFATYVMGSTNSSGKGECARIDTCFTATEFIGLGKKYAETSSPVRISLVDTNNLKQAGFIVKSIYDSTLAKGAETQGRSGSTIFSGPNEGRSDGLRYSNLDGRTSTDDCKNSVGPFTKDNRNFNYSEIWSLGNGEYPIVRDVKTIA